MVRKIKEYILPILLFIPAIIPWCMSGFPLTDDGGWMVIRLSAFFETFRGGDFPVRFISRLNNGYGYPVSDFLYPLYLYIGSLMHLTGLSFVLVVKSLFILSFIFSGYISYIWLRTRVRTLIAIIGSIFYAYFPYHFVDMNRRGSLGEMLSFAILPFILWQIERKSILWTGIGIFLLLTSHNIQALLFLPIIILYLFVEKKEFIQKGLVACVAGAGMSAWFIFPALLDQQLTVFSHTVVSSAPVYEISPVWLVFSVCFLGSLSVLGFLQRKRIIVFWSLCLMVVFICMSPVSHLLWTPNLLLRYVQFPIRLWGVATCIMVILVIHLSNYFSLTALRFFLIGIIIVAIIAAYSGRPVAFQHFPDSFYTTNESTTTTKNEYMPTVVKTLLLHETYPDVFMVTGRGAFGEVLKRGNSRTITVVTEENAVVGIHAIYFPGWNISVDGKQVGVTPMKGTGLVTFPVGPGSHTIRARFTETIQHLFFDIFALCSLLLTILLAWYDRKYAQNH